MILPIIEYDILPSNTNLSSENIIKAFENSNNIVFNVYNRNSKKIETLQLRFTMLLNSHDTPHLFEFQAILITDSSEYICDVEGTYNSQDGSGSIKIDYNNYLVV
ncbi:MAG: hypothetical protein A2725_03210 [Candidatus Magasanikbacteria bacterium RIFCSPHIGHO2_01_FULL_33_34]|uniref:Uncharacterized protein n=1 Tax=Candidatus Magasanikbacteria bacterium RIFCSPHIGHO2_01_FULL_33_34 TaxID=1798671 RepID=A0A1F6LGV1_9BACT|nr:MAG: hypothetical protein A2725_03210 [Candidatus Magasanikbacteria bacterium RIFCSPHIGHO2_01_FULL_33_34]OGH66139.1 MAG: hypothetical protein A3B83_00700 [Candidatus Magasanikbacteria bacterium RIFCSPHIGHO2_02_FULL_33_17]OGH75985.1 MAG: hypothetical protein A3A89_00610 [Candidatus Magasanikbacteria bacterium RIFCSPLOWO2_01_FULL_33_34]OGH81573.1 MAG: hypothetical protein A3F93_03365 [Candidatus Magasanikbacteria bacterium RIFCSPLOWO2_12_FULL_34_7]